MSDCPVCGGEEYEKDSGCDDCGHYDEYKAKRKLKPSCGDKRLDPRF